MSHTITMMAIAAGLLVSAQAQPGADGPVTDAVHAPSQPGADSLPGADAVVVPSWPAADAVHAPSWPAADAVRVPSKPGADAVVVPSWPAADAVHAPSWPAADAVRVPSKPGADAVVVPSWPAADAVHAPSWPAADAVHAPSKPGADLRRPVTQVATSKVQGASQPGADVVRNPSWPAADAVHTPSWPAADAIHAPSTPGADSLPGADGPQDAVARKSTPSATGASTVNFSGYTWNVRGGTGGPGPNTWNANNVWVDTQGRLHLQITNNNGVWSTAEIYTSQRFGFGTFQYEVVGQPNTLDDNVVLGLFNYPTSDVGPDGTNEIDIEFATWGGVQANHGNWTVYPSVVGPTPASHPYGVASNTTTSTHRYTWQSKQVSYQSLNGFHRLGDNSGAYANWTFAPADYLSLVPQQATPVHMNFWLFKGQPPKNGKPVEVIISSFSYKPL